MAELCQSLAILVAISFLSSGVVVTSLDVFPKIMDRVLLGGFVSVIQNA